MLSLVRVQRKETGSGCLLRVKSRSAQTKKSWIQYYDQLSRRRFVIIFRLVVSGVFGKYAYELETMDL